MWEGGYQVQQRNRESIEIWYDPLLASQAAIDEEARRHCAQFNHKHELAKATHGLGVVSNKITYRCVPQS